VFFAVATLTTKRKVIITGEMSYVKERNKKRDQTILWLLYREKYNHVLLLKEMGLIGPKIEAITSA
jgi:hypothetical protein